MVSVISKEAKKFGRRGESEFRSFETVDLCRKIFTPTLGRKLPWGFSPAKASMTRINEEEGMNRGTEEQSVREDEKNGKASPLYPLRSALPLSSTTSSSNEYVVHRSADFRPKERISINDWHKYYREWPPSAYDAGREPWPYGSCHYLLPAVVTSYRSQVLDQIALVTHGKGEGQAGSRKGNCTTPNSHPKVMRMVAFSLITRVRARDVALWLSPAKATHQPQLYGEVCWRSEGNMNHSTPSPPPHSVAPTPVDSIVEASKLIAGLHHQVPEVCRDGVRHGLCVGPSLQHKAPSTHLGALAFQF
ncbi:hypothetical protein QBC37DRAFT_482248 [Rhypophila decipiens]|uniref:Uncharacterized protein n=1 Tax=Rhypophila decipiens TaxID=261697 RepID=A0AAN6Y9A9_9PEZI|nr:hypothetical protein QBC37DRAFT_482248 [Rhypophila decipiens]